MSQERGRKGEKMSVRERMKKESEIEMKDERNEGP